MNKEISNLLLIGIDLVGLAYSSKRAGYKVYALDYFCDRDLKMICETCLSTQQKKAGKPQGQFNSNFDPSRFVELANQLTDEVNIDAILLSSGLDDSINVLHELDELTNILGNNPDTIRRIRDREAFFKELGRLEIPHPKSKVINSLIEAKSYAKDINFPVVLKPLEGFAGFGIRKADDQVELESIYNSMMNVNRCGLLIQEYVEGTHASISFIASSSGSEIMTYNEQLLGLDEVYQSEPFGYCGNIVPFKTNKNDSIMNTCDSLIKKIARSFNLRGSNGIDMVIKDNTPYIIEVNPRFQGTIECVEHVLGVNLVEMHIKACLHGSLPQQLNEPKSTCTRLILYAPERIYVPDLKLSKEIRDVPFPNTSIEAGEPLCSVIMEGRDRETSLKKALDKADSIYKLLLTELQLIHPRARQCKRY